MNEQPDEEEAMTVAEEYFCTLSTPVGELLLVGSVGILREIVFPNNRARREEALEGIARPAVFEKARKQLAGYFDGTLREFDLVLELEGTAFQRGVWEALQHIPYGETWSYQDLAERMGDPGAVRAVAAANGRNPIPIIVPCHRVIGSDGKLRGYAGGLATKAALLDLEFEGRVR
jgi:methylated-DNA-[protein]-cysteine S-methyltransferase